MSVHYKDVIDYLDEHPVLYEHDSVTTLLELLHEVYTTHNTVDSEALRAGFQKVDDLLEKLTIQEQDAFLDVVCDLCMECEQLAFSHGVVVGMHLMMNIRCL